MIFVYTACANVAEAKKIAHSLIKEKLVSCANFFPCESIYHWDGRATEAKECILLVKTEDGLYGEIKEAIQNMHSYELPVIASIPVEFNEEYVAWMERVLR